MIFLSPGVKTREIDYSTYVGDISSCIVGMVGAATKGPVMEPTLVTSPSDFIDTFGEPTMLDYGAYCALEFLKQGNQLIYTRVGESTLAKAKATISAGLITVAAKEYGTYGDKFAVELLKGDIDEDDGVTQLYQLIIYRDDAQEEIFTVSFDSDREDWIENVESYWVTVEYNYDQEIEPYIESFPGFMMDDNNNWHRAFPAGSDTLDTLAFETNVPVASTKLSVISDSRSQGGFAPGDQVGIPVVDGTSFTITGLGIDFPDTNVYNPGSPESQGTEVGEKAYEDPSISVPVAETFQPDGGDATDVTFAEGKGSFQPAATVTSDPEAEFRTAFTAWLLDLGIDSDDQGTALTEVDVENLISVTGVPATPQPGTVSSTAPGVITEGEVGDPYYVMTYSETTPYTEVTEYTASVELTGVYYDNGDGTKALCNLTFTYTFTQDDAYNSVETFNQTYTRVDLPDAFEIDFKIDLVAETGLTTTQHIFISCVDEPVVVTEDASVAPVGSPKPGVVIKPTDSPVPFEGGEDGAPVSIQNVFKGVALYENTEDLDINLIAAPGRFETEIVQKLLEVAQNRADTLAIIDPPQGLSYRDVINYHNGKLAGDHYPKQKLNTSYGAFFYPWVKVYDEFSGENIWLPPCGVVLASFAYNDRVAQPWFAAAGLNRGMLSTVIELEVTLDEGKRDALYGNGNAVNALVNYKQQGFTIWGNKTLQRKTSALDRINVRRLMNMVRKAIAATSAYLIFEQNDQLTWAQWKNQVDPYLEGIKRSRGLDGYRTKMDEETVTPYYRDRNQMPGKVWINPTRTAEFIPIDFILTSSGAQFND